MFCKSCVMKDSCLGKILPVNDSHRGPITGQSSGHLMDPSLKSQSAWAWQNWARVPQGDVCRSQNGPVKPWRQEPGLHRPSESGWPSHSPWIQGQAEDTQVRRRSGEASLGWSQIHGSTPTYLCHIWDRICWRRSSTDSENP